MDEAFGKVVGGLIGFFILLYIIMWAVAILMVVASLVLGVVALTAAKSGKALVTEQHSGRAFVMALSWSAVLTVGCTIGSFGLLISLYTALGPAFEDRMAQVYNANSAGTLWSAWIFIDQWIMTGAYLFWLKTALILYLANRMFLARELGGNAWFGVIPPLFAMVLFFITDHWGIISNALNNPSLGNITSLQQALWSVLILPFELAWKAFGVPDQVVAWARERVILSDGSLFRLKLFPSAFLIVGLAMVVKIASGSFAHQDATG